MNSKISVGFFTGMIAAIVLCAASTVAFGASPPPTGASTASPTLQATPPADLVDERPGTMGLVWHYATVPIVWTWGILRDDLFAWMTPPSPASITNAVSEKEANQLFKFLGSAGYKLKDIDTDIGIIPGITFKFSKVRELSEADYENLESEVADWERTTPGVYAGLQRKIIKTIIGVNAGLEYEVSSLKVELLPLPDVSFEMSPKGESDEKDALKRVINRLEHSVQALSKALNPNGSAHP